MNAAERALFAAKIADAAPRRVMGVGKRFVAIAISKDQLVLCTVQNHFRMAPIRPGAFRTIRFWG
jgi:hypothetical protein